MKYLGIGLVYAWRLHVRAPDARRHLQVPPELLAVRARRLARHGLVKGSAKAAWRLLRCNPWSHGGVDYA
jgi:hypothetical protein